MFVHVFSVLMFWFCFIFLLFVSHFLLFAFLFASLDLLLFCCFMCFFSFWICLLFLLVLFHLCCFFLDLLFFCFFCFCFLQLPFLITVLFGKTIRDSPSGFLNPNPFQHILSPAPLKSASSEDGAPLYPPSFIRRLPKGGGAWKVELAEVSVSTSRFLCKCMCWVYRYTAFPATKEP